MVGAPVEEGLCCLEHLRILTYPYRTRMLINLSRRRLAGLWMMAVAVMAACSVAFGMALTVSNGELWVVAGVVPPVILLMLWPRADPVTVAQVLHSVNGSSKGGRS